MPVNLRGYLESQDKSAPDNHVWQKWSCPETFTAEHLLLGRSISLRFRSLRCDCGPKSSELVTVCDCGFPRMSCYCLLSANPASPNLVGPQPIMDDLAMRTQDTCDCYLYKKFASHMFQSFPIFHSFQKSDNYRNDIMETSGVCTTH